MKTEGKGSIVIVGAGTMGLFLAHELMSRGKRIVLIESGHEQSESFRDDEFKNLGHPHTGIAIGRAKGIGGTTNLWGGQLAQFVPVDIESKGNYGQPDWNITWAELTKYYSKTYAKLGFQPDSIEYPEKLINTSSGKTLESFYTYWLRNPNFKNHFHEALKGSNLVTILEDTTVTNLHFKAGECTGLDLVNAGNKDSIHDFDNIVLANGTLEICRLLLSTVNNPDCPYVDNRWIGKYYQDHLNLRIGSVQNASKEFFNKFSNIVRDGNKLQPKIRLNSGPDKKYLGVSGYFAFSSDVTQHLDNFKQFARAVMGRSHNSSSLKDKAMMFVKVVKALPQIMPLIFRYLKDNKIYVPFNSKVTLCIQAQQLSIKDSEITISTEKDNTGRPKVLLNWKLDGREFDSIREFCEALQQYLKENKYGNLVFEEWFKQDCAHNTGRWMDHTTDIYHMAGGTIMSPSKESGVLDDNLRIHGSANMFIVGPCVMPTSSYANTGFTALALTSKLADHLTEK